MLADISYIMDIYSRYATLLEGRFQLNCFVIVNIKALDLILYMFFLSGNYYLWILIIELLGFLKIGCRYFWGRERE